MRKSLVYACHRRSDDPELVRGPDEWTQVFGGFLSSRANQSHNTWAATRISAQGEVAVGSCVQAKFLLVDMSM